MITGFLAVQHLHFRIQQALFHFLGDGFFPGEQLLQFSLALSQRQALGDHGAHHGFNFCHKLLTKHAKIFTPANTFIDQRIDEIENRLGLKDGLNTVAQGDAGNKGCQVADKCLNPEVQVGLAQDLGHAVIDIGQQCMVFLGKQGATMMFFNLHQHGVNMLFCR